MYDKKTGMPSHRRTAKTTSCRDMVRPSDGAGIAHNQAAAWGSAQAVSHALSRKVLFVWRTWKWAASMTTCSSCCPAFRRSTLLRSRPSSRRAILAASSPTRGVPISCSSSKRRWQSGLEKLHEPRKAAYWVARDSRKPRPPIRQGNVAWTHAWSGTEVWVIRPSDRRPKAVIEAGPLLRGKLKRHRAQQVVYLAYWNAAAEEVQRHLGNRMVLTYNNVGHNLKRPQIGVLLNKRATKHAPFLLYKFGVRW